MKKVVLFFAVSAAVALASCGGNANNDAQAVDSVAVEVVEAAEEVVADSATIADSIEAAVDSATAAAAAAVDSVVAE